jgi:hypothetical protein
MNWGTAWQMEKATQIGYPLLDWRKSSLNFFSKKVFNSIKMEMVRLEGE